MVPNQVEREMTIEAPIDVVWRVVTDPEHMKQWFAAEAELNTETGHGRLRFQQGQVFFLHIEAFEPPRRFAYRWLREEATTATPKNSMLVEFTLDVDGDGTRVRVRESGFDQVDWSDAVKAKYAEDHDHGWQRYLGLLNDYAQRAKS